MVAITYKKVIFNLKKYLFGRVRGWKVIFTLVQAIFEGQCPVLHSFNSILRPSVILEIQVITEQVLHPVVWTETGLATPKTINAIDNLVSFTSLTIFFFIF